MKPRLALLFLLPITLILAGCDAMMGFNLFQSKVKLDKITTVDEVKSYAGDQAFYDALAADPAGKADVLALLAADPSTENRALAAQIELETTPAIEVANSFMQELPTFMDALDLGTAETSLGGMLERVLPPSIDLGSADAPAAFVDLINGFLDAATQYAAIAATPGAIIDDTSYLSAGDVAYYAIVSFAVREVASNALNGATPADRIETIWDAITLGGAISFDDTQLDFSNPVSDSSLILAAAGIDLASLF